MENLSWDCHRRGYLEVESELPNWILLNQSNLPLTIITGNSPAMKAVIEKICEEWDFGWREDWKNGGRIIIDRI